MTFTSKSTVGWSTIILTACGIVLTARCPGLAANIAVPTQHNDNLRTGDNRSETVLNPSNVNSTKFGALFTLSLDDDVAGQVLYVPQLHIAGGVHNVIFAYTNGNSDNSPSSVYAFEADNYHNGNYLWRLQLPNSAQWTTCTPTIDTTNNIIYVLTKETTNTGTNQLHAIDLLTGEEMPGSPVTISATIAGTGDASNNGQLSFNTAQENCRAGLLFLNGIVYAGFSHNSDSYPYHGWLFGYKYTGTGFTQTAVYCTTPNAGLGGIWQSGNGIVADSAGYIYVASGNGGFDAANTPPGIDYGMTYIKLSTPGLKVVDWFTPFDELNNSNSDLDLGGAGIVGVGSTDRIFAGGTKFGAAFLLDTGNMGHFTPGGPDKVVNRINNVSGNGVVGQNPVSWDQGPSKYIYLWPRGSNLQQFRYLTAQGKIVPDTAYKVWNNTTGAQLTVSSSEGGDGILWAQCYDNVIRAFRAGDVSKGEIWDSNIDASRDGINSIGHWQFITVVNGHMYVPTGNAQIKVYGLLH